MADKKQATESEEPKDRCPNCGYCEHCGQSRIRPYPWHWSYPYTFPVTTGPLPVTFTTQHQYTGSQINTTGNTLRIVN